jgi:hypothetical protein
MRVHPAFFLSAKRNGNQPEIGSLYDGGTGICHKDWQLIAANLI